jgi:hypothetical protein
MARIVQIECNGPNKHVNEVDPGELLKPTVVSKGFPSSIPLPDDVPERFVMKCRFCTEGRVIITREMLLEMLND